WRVSAPGRGSSTRGNGRSAAGLCSPPASTATRRSSSGGPAGRSRSRSGCRSTCPPGGGRGGAGGWGGGGGAPRGRGGRGAGGVWELRAGTVVYRTALRATTGVTDEAATAALDDVRAHAAAAAKELEALARA